MGRGGELLREKKNEGTREASRKQRVFFFLLMFLLVITCMGRHYASESSACRGGRGRSECLEQKFQAVVRYRWCELNSSGRAVDALNWRVGQKPGKPGGEMDGVRVRGNRNLPGWGL